MSAIPLRSWTRAEYQKAAEVGLFGPDEKLELLDGQIVQKVSPQGTPHIVCLRLIAKWLEDEVGHSSDIRQQAPIALSDRSEPEPDIAVVKGRPEDYLAEHPGPGDIQLIVEISDSSLVRDVRVKAPLYAAAGIEELWIVELSARQIHVYRSPTIKGYQSAMTLGESDMISPEFLQGRQALVADLLPKRSSQ